MFLKRNLNKNQVFPLLHINKQILMCVEGAKGKRHWPFITVQAYSQAIKNIDIFSSKIL